MDGSAELFSLRRLSTLGRNGSPADGVRNAPCPDVKTTATRFSERQASTKASPLSGRQALSYRLVAQDAAPYALRGHARRTLCPAGSCTPHPLPCGVFFAHPYTLRAPAQVAGTVSIAATPTQQSRHPPPALACLHARVRFLCRRPASTAVACSAVPVPASQCPHAPATVHARTHARTHARAIARTSTTGDVK